MSHTKEPWLPYSEVATQMHPILDHSCVLMDIHDYARARACVNACAGIDTDALETHIGSVVNTIYAIKQQRDDLQALCRELVKTLKRVSGLSNEYSIAEMAIDQISKTEGKL